MTFTILGFLLALVSPLLLLPVESLLPFPYVIEEVVKLAIVLIILKSFKPSGVWVLVAGFFFSFSESIFYLTNIFALGNFAILFTRLLVTSGLHISTMILMYLSAKLGRVGVLLGFIGAVLIHYFFNLWIASGRF